MKKLICICLLIGLAACKSRNLTANSSNKFVIEDVARVATAEKLREIYPDANIKEGTDMFEEGTVQRAYTILYPNTNDEMIITWKDAERTQLHNMRVEKEGRWKSSTGLKVGSTYNELVEINDAPASFYGFGWDYSGAVDYEGGKLDDSNIRAFVAPQNTPPNSFYGDRKVDATQEEIDNLKLRVRSILYQDVE